MKQLIHVLSIAIAIILTVCIPNVCYSSECTPHASTMGESVWVQLARTLSVSSADKLIYQSDVPYTITAPGAYGVGENLTNEGSSPVINITGSAGGGGVILDLHNHSIVASVDATTAIQASSISNAVQVVNGIIDGFPIGTSSCRIIRDMMFVNCTTGISNGYLIVRSDGYSCGTFFIVTSSAGAGFAGWLRGCKIFSSTTSAITIQSTQGITIDSCLIAGGAGINIINESSGCIIRSCVIENMVGNAITVVSGYSHAIVDCLLTGGVNGIVINNTATINPANPLIRDCVISHYSGTGISIDSAITTGSITGCTISDTNIGISANSSVAVYNNYLSNITTTTFAGVSPAQATRAQVAADQANFWFNVVD